MTRKLVIACFYAFIFAACSWGIKNLSDITVTGKIDEWANLDEVVEMSTADYQKVKRARRLYLPTVLKSIDTTKTVK